MDRKTAKKHAMQFASDLEGPIGRIPLEHVIEAHIGFFNTLVRRHINWNTQRPDLREALVHLVGYIKRHVCGIASAGSSLFCV